MPQVKKGGRIPGPAKIKIVNAADIPGLVFGASSQGRKSEYAEALTSLAASPEGTVLEIEKISARASLTTRARKMGIQVLFGELDGKLYVKAIGARTPEGLVLELLGEGPKNMVELTGLVEKRFPEAKLQPMLSQLSSSGQIALRDVPGKTGKAWYLTNGAKSAAV